VTTRSCLYGGTVRHRRFTPAVHRFSYRIGYLFVDLDELPTLFKPYWLWSVDRPNAASFRRADHLGDPSAPLRQAVEDVVEARLGWRPRGAISLLTQFRYFGFGFNPVSFYFCYNETGDSIDAIVAEVDNTPWLEQFAYVLDVRTHAAQGRSPAGPWEFRMPKQFHVSPLLPMDMEYRWHFSHPGKHLNVHMENWKDDAQVFDATMTLERRELTSRSLAQTLGLFPLASIKVVAAIYFQALRLRLKGCPFYPHPSAAGASADSSDS